MGNKASILPDGISTGNETLDYDEGTFVAPFNTGMNTSTTNVTVKYIKVGKQVTLNLPSTQVTAGATTTVWGTGAGAIPTALRPAVTTMFLSSVVYNNSLVEGGFVYTYSAGQLFVVRTSNWTSGTANCGFPDISVTYTVQ
jgi:hypothetical protein